jgi:hypothetical protein
MHRSGSSAPRRRDPANRPHTACTLRAILRTCDHADPTSGAVRRERNWGVRYIATTEEIAARLSRRSFRWIAENGERRLRGCRQGRVCPTRNVANPRSEPSRLILQLVVTLLVAVWNSAMALRPGRDRLPVGGQGLGHRSLGRRHRGNSNPFVRSCNAASYEVLASISNASVNSPASLDIALASSTPYARQDQDTQALTARDHRG